MGFDFSGMKNPIINNASFAAEIGRQLEESNREIAQATQERIEREEKMVAGAEANIAQKELLEKQVEFIQKQNELLLGNYTKLEEMYNAQVEANKETKKELKWSKRFNLVMMVIAIIAMLAAIAGPIVTIIFNK